MIRLERVSSDLNLQERTGRSCERVCLMLRKDISVECIINYFNLKSYLGQTCQLFVN